MGKMGIKGLRRADLSDPRTNLDIGATYFQGLHRRWKGHLPLAMASYNAGPNAVQRWVDRRGSMRLDAWVETIPYKQTRLYVKKVSASWQTYHALYGELSDSPWIPLREGPIDKNIGSKTP